ncbi:hypothetical protein Pmani_014205 [Petrolisthes manimaculis]|uniref:Reverse transcriptase domain-containing protein n=1 Tax=Petrolisthes manimaculis TaxID=1843537 RepID=A0AAE1PVU0_9EUCA|nr:hypothetical protein Pmani_014205 [Petrolisthes manimaculis]
MPHVSFDFIYQYLLKGVWPPTVCTKGEKANFRKACRPFVVKDEELFYKKVKNDETGEKVQDASLPASLRHSYTVAVRSSQSTLRQVDQHTQAIYATTPRTQPRTDPAHHRSHRVIIRDSASDWLPMKSGVPQGSVLGPILFVIYINDLVANLESAASLFADDAKIYKTIRTEADVETLQRDMERLNEWSRKWLLTFNASKCKIMHISHDNQGNDYQLGGVTLQKSSTENDLGITISSDLKSSAHVAKVAAKANNRLGIIKRNFTVHDKEIILPLYLSLVRPILDFGVQCWSPHLAKDIQALERIQRRATRLVPDLT